MLGLDYKKYKRMCWRIKSETKKLVEGKVQGRVLKPLMHREEFRLELPREVVEGVVFESSRRRPGVRAKPVGEWYVVPNRNRMCFFRGEFVNVRVWPKSGSCRVLPCRPMPFGWVETAVQTAFFKAGVDLRVCEELSQKLDANSKHRVFKVGPVTPFKIKHYKPSLGLTILADGSHPDHLETVEDYPVWVKPLLEGFRVLKDFPGRMEVIAESFRADMEKHMEIIEVFRQESIKRNKVLEELAGSNPAQVPRGTMRARKKSQVQSSGDMRVREIQRRVEEALEKLRRSDF